MSDVGTKRTTMNLQEGNPSPTTARRLRLPASAAPIHVCTQPTPTLQFSRGQRRDRCSLKMSTRHAILTDLSRAPHYTLRSSREAEAASRLHQFPSSAGFPAALLVQTFHRSLGSWTLLCLGFPFLIFQTFRSNCLVILD